MATIYQCDRCKTQFGHSDKLQPLQMKKYHDRAIGQWTSSEVDLCAECHALVRQLVRSAVPVEQKEGGESLDPREGILKG